MDTALIDKTSTVTKELTFKIDSGPLDLESRIIPGSVVYDLALGNASAGCIGGIYDPQSGGDLRERLARDLADVCLASTPIDAIASAVRGHIERASEEAKGAELRFRRQHTSGQIAGEPIDLVIETPPIMAKAGLHGGKGDGNNLYAEQVGGYFDMLAGDNADIILMHAEDNEVFASSDLRISVYGGARVKGRCRFAMLDVNASLESKICLLLNGFGGAASRCPMVMKTARTAHKLAEITGKIVRIYDAIRAPSGVIKVSYCVEAPYIKPDVYGGEQDNYSAIFSREAQKEQVEA